MNTLRGLVRHWHRRLGIAASLFLIWLAASGVLLNESTRLGLDRARVASPLLMHWYGLAALAPERGYAAGGHWLVETPDATLLDGHPLAAEARGVLGVVRGGDAAQPLLFVATAASLVLLDGDGGLVETLAAASLPVTAIRRIGRTGDGRVVIQDLDAYASRDGESWTRLAAEPVEWAAPQPLPEDQRRAALPYSQPSLSLQRVLGDAHSGRLFGRYGPFVIDLAGLFAVLLAGSGLWMVWRASIRARHRHAGH